MEKKNMEDGNVVPPSTSSRHNHSADDLHVATTVAEVHNALTVKQPFMEVDQGFWQLVQNNRKKSKPATATAENTVVAKKVQGQEGRVATTPKQELSKYRLGVSDVYNTVYLAITALEN